MNITTEFFKFKSAQADNFDLLDQICQKGFFWSKTENVNTTIECCTIQISLRTKFLLKLTMSIFWAKFTQKIYFRSKREVNIPWKNPYSK